MARASSSDIRAFSAAISSGRPDRSHAQLRFVPDAVPVKQGETVTFEVSTMGQTVHEFMVGPAADVAAETPATPEIQVIEMMEPRSVYTFDGPGPFDYACHAPGHYEAGMTGTIAVVPSSVR